MTQQNAQVQILNNGHRSESISIKCGLPQGCGLSPFLFVLAIEGLANTIRADDRIPGITIGGTCKKVAQVADDTLLSFFGSRPVAQRVKCVLDHFSQLSGLKLNYEKSSLIALGKNVPNWFADDCVKDIRKKHISEGFSYLRLGIGNMRLQENFLVEPNLVNRLLDTRVHRRTGLSGRILQMKQLVASTFVYRFQLLPSPTVAFTRTIDSQLHNYVWEQGRHRMRKELLWQPTSQGGLGMINVFIQNKALKFAWFQHPLLNILTAILKNYIHVCKWLVCYPTVTGLVQAINKARNIHFNKCKCNNFLAKHHKLWEALAHDVPMNNIIKCWQIIEDV